MSAVRLEERDPARNRMRFCAVTVTPTLFGPWAVVREWGRIGQPGTVREEWFETAELAEAAGLRLIRRKERRGYQAAGQ
jgi:predicted DNA-binding WGR domain protein